MYQITLTPGLAAHYVELAPRRSEAVTISCRRRVARCRGREVRPASIDGVVDVQVIQEVVDASVQTVRLDNTWKEKGMLSFCIPSIFEFCTAILQFGYHS